MDYEELGIVEAAHIGSVPSGGSDELSKALALCRHHCALFDEGIWTSDGKRIIRCGGIPEGIMRTLAHAQLQVARWRT